jgi:hypothetical protein
MTSTIRLQHIYRGVSMLPRDVYVNTFHFSRVGVAGPGTPITNTEANALIAAVESFFNLTSTGQTTPIWSYIDQKVLASPAAQYKIYDLADPKPRSPFVDVVPTGQPANTVGSGLPQELAVCLSYNASFAQVAEFAVPRARKRGRIYIGPLNTRTLYGYADFTSHPHPTFLTALRISGKRLQDLAVTAGWNWVVHSPTTAALNNDPENFSLTGDFPVEAVSTDDAWDIQRRRGLNPTGRTALLVD